MMYPYITLADKTEVTSSHLIEDNGEQCECCEELENASFTPSESVKYSDLHKLDCFTCQIFLDEGCETHYDCSACCECAELGGVWEPRR